MSALDRPAEILLLAVFSDADPAEAAARAFLRGGLDASHVTILTRESRGASFAAVPRSASLRMEGLGRAVAHGALAVELGRGSVTPGATERVVTALRRLGLSVTDVPRLARIIRADLVLVLAAVPREQALGWGRLLQGQGAVSLTARPRLSRWPPAARAVVGRRLGTARSATSSGPSRLVRDGPDGRSWADRTGS